MTTVAIIVTPPGGSPNDITGACIFNRCSFTGHMNAVAGQFTVVVRDPDRVLSFTTGSEILCEIDGVALFGGYITKVEMGSMAPAADTADLDAYYLRTWTLTGPDFNILFDRRVWRNTSDFLNAIDLSAFTMDGAILREAIDNYADMSDFDSSGIEDIASIPTGDVLQQGDTLRKEFQNLSYFGGAVWYIRPDKKIIYMPYDDAEKRWGFSDNPNLDPITVSPDEFQGATYPFRSVEGKEDGSYMVNDALIWGGSEFAGSGGGTVFARETNATSITDHKRWQVGETHFGERKYSIQAQVDARASVIVNGPPGADITGQQKGLRFPQWEFRFTWFSVDVPELSGTPDHIRAGDLVTINLSVFSVTKLLPVRELRISFPDAFDANGERVVQFDGTFGLQLSDPFSLWAYLLAAQTRAASTVRVPQVVGDGSTSTSYGARYTGEPTPSPNGSATAFTIPFGYLAGSVQVFLNGLIQRSGVDFTESDPAAGEITMSSAPLSTDNLLVSAYTLEA